jgi:hypothetical protein
MRLKDLRKKDDHDDIAESASSGATAAGAVASIANPMGAINRRPSLFGWMPMPQEKSKGKKRRKPR